MRYAYHLLFFILFTLALPAQTHLQTPAQFLGYSLGEQFTTHDKMIRYVEHAASQATDRAKLIPYGTTYEGRPLVLLVITSPANLSRLEEIRTNHLKSIGLMSGSAGNAKEAIAWLSYNIHGNESVSSEAVMQVIYDLLDTKNAKTQQWLNNTVVILDPCMNPDGRERYVQWYRQVANQPYTISPWSREHMEPWPGGRPNHYLFDLNRDWAWATQKETQQRLALYNQWMPHLHADFHEQGLNAPYYFSPAAKPFHPEITPYQRRFQNTIGDFNRKYFDANHWLYFTRERFDLFYPSYGDTWPTFNGAIGMTYEQGGSGRAGLGVLREEGDTLTLKERIAHHYTASMATLEAVAANQEEMTREFTEYFKKAASAPGGKYKTYLFKAKGAESQIKALASYLGGQGIQYGYAGKSSHVKGFRYTTGKDESVKMEENDLIISTYQPKSTLLRVLMEPNPPLEDSLTYDITSWALPYAFGLDAYGLTEKLTPSGAPAKPAQASTAAAVARPYAYLVRWQGLPDLQFLASLLKQQIKVRYAEAPFQTGGQEYASGTLIITRTGNEDKGDAFDRLVQRAADSLQVTLAAVPSGFVTTGSDFGSDRVHYIKPPRVAVMMGSSVSSTAFGEVWHYFEQQIGYPVTVLDAAYLSSVPLNQFDVLIMPSGTYGGALGERTLNSLKDWIRTGGRLIALESAVQFFVDKPDFELKRKKRERKPESRSTQTMPYDTLPVYANREREFLKEEVAGAIYRISLDNSHPLAFGYRDTYYALLREAYDLELLPKGWNVGYLRKDGYISGYAGSKAREKLKDTFVIGVQEMGGGQIIYLTNSPLFRAFWHSGKLLFGNAVFLAGQQ